jgi:uncharacterized protein YkwD
MSPASLDSLARVLAVAAGLAALLLLAGSAAESDARGKAGCSKTRAAGKASDTLRRPDARRAVRCLINQERSGRNLKPKEALTKAAQRHSRYMYKHGCFAHQCAGEPSTVDRIQNAGYMRGASSWRVGEVIALNGENATPREIVRQWKNSAGHRAQILSGSYEHLGIGMVARGGRAFYTVTLGAKSG